MTYKIKPIKITKHLVEIAIVVAVILALVGCIAVYQHRKNVQAVKDAQTAAVARETAIKHENERQDAVNRALDAEGKNTVLCNYIAVLARTNKTVKAPAGSCN